MKTTFAVKLLTLVAIMLALASPANAATSKLKNNLRVTGNLQVDGTSTVAGAATQTGNFSVGGNLAVTGTSAHTGAATFSSASFGTTTLHTGVATFSAQPVFSIPLIKSNLGNQSKRVIYTMSVNGGATVADATTYRGWFVPGRAGSVTKVSVIAATPPIGGTSTVKILKGSSSGNTMLGAASYDPVGLTANQAAAMTLTGTAADLAVTASGANSGVYIEWAAGTQSTDAINAAISIEFEADDY